jgi:hypothetical protein
LRRLEQKARDEKFPITAQSAKNAIAALTANQITTHERLATFISDDGFKSKLLIQNLRLDAPIKVTPALIINQNEIPLAPITMPPHTTATVDITSTLLALGRSHARGLAVVRYDYDTYGAVSAVVTSSDDQHRLYLNSIGQSPEEFWYGTALDAVVWAPEAGTEGFVAITNTTAEPRTVQATFVVNGRSDEIHEVEMAPYQHRLLRIDSIVRRSRESGAGVRISWSGKPGDVITEGELFNRRTGFSKYIRFLDTSLHFAEHSLRTHFLLLGRQPAADAFPAQMSFRSIAAVRNIDPTPVQVTPVVKRVQNGSVQTISLKPVTISANETTLIDFGMAQKAGNLPADFDQGSLQLVPNTDHNSIVAELFNLSESNNFVVGPSFSSFPTRATGSIWRIDGSYQTTIMVENTVNATDNVTLKLFSDRGSYEKTFPVASGGILKINVRELLQNHVPDNDGNLLVATSGTLTIFGGLGLHSKLSFDKLIHSADESEYVGLLAEPCNHVESISLFFDQIDQFNLSAVIDAFWTDGSVTEDSGFPSSENSSLASVNGSVVTLHPVDNSSHNVTMDAAELDTACDICSSDWFYTSAPVTVPPRPDCSTATVALEATTTIPLEFFFPNRLTGVGAATTMGVFPSPVIWNGAQIQELVTLTSNTCPASFGTPPCGGHDTFTVGDGSAPIGPLVFPPSVNTFYDFHVSLIGSSVLDPPPPLAPIPSCRAVCSQTYSCNGAIIGRFTITRDVTRDTISGVPVSRVAVTKQ